MENRIIILDSCIIGELLYTDYRTNNKLLKLIEVIECNNYKISITIFTLLELLNIFKDNFNLEGIRSLVANLNNNKVEIYNYSYFNSYKVPDIYEMLYNCDKDSFNSFLNKLHNEDSKAKSDLISSFFISLIYIYLIIDMYSEFNNKTIFNNKYKLVIWFGDNCKEFIYNIVNETVIELLDQIWLESLNKKQIRNQSENILKSIIGICLFVEDKIQNGLNPNSDDLISQVHNSIDTAIEKVSFKNTLHKLNNLKTHFKTKSNEETLSILLKKSVKFQNDFLRETCIYLFETSPFNNGKIDLNDWTDLLNIYCLEKFSSSSVYITLESKWIKFLNNKKSELKYLEESSYYCNLINDNNINAFE